MSALLRHLILVFAMVATAATAAQALVLTSPAFTDGGTLSTDAAGPGDCGGKDISPPLRWTGAPATTKSFGILVMDLDGRNALGVVHWIAYGIKPDVTSFPAGLASSASPMFIGGVNNRNLGTFLGLCPPKNDPPHHYVFTAYALDLAPDALQPGLNRDAFMAAITGHALAASVIIGTYARK
ncbi:MAG TPA: YbhB/YbcL family Raf kinase inhibitor-like protein [Candidatus Binatia bacterium]|nr:YbhB/YbcL family Raf kinase inhibitor-like protein [Candidatus Binatia bacterium]